MSLFSSYPGKVAQAQGRRDLTWGERLNVATNLSLLGSVTPASQQLQIHSNYLKLGCAASWNESFPCPEVWTNLWCLKALQMLQNVTTIYHAGFAELLLDCFHIFLTAASVACRPCPAQSRKQNEKPETEHSHAPEVKRLSRQRSIWLLNQKLQAFWIATINDHEESIVKCCLCCETPGGTI